MPKTYMKSLALSFILLLSLSFLACNSQKKVEKNEIDLEEIFGKTWQLEKFSFHEEQYENIEISKVSLQFDSTNARINGNDGCNQFSGQYSIQGDSLFVDKIASTKMYCGKEHSLFLRSMNQILSACKFQFENKNSLILINEESSLNYKSIN